MSRVDTMRGQSWLLAGRRILDPDARASQQLLAIAHRDQTRPLCGCVEGGVETYVARTPGGRFIIKRLPNSGPRHHPDCDSYEPPQALTGRGSIDVDDDPDGLTVLRLGFPLHRDQDHARSSRGRPGQRQPAGRHHAAAAGHLSLEALLHYLWDAAGFTRWSPRMVGKRHWSLIRYHLLRVAEQTLLDGQSLADLVWIPEPFDRRRREEIETRRKEAWEPLKGDPARPDHRRFGLAIFEWSSIKPARYGQAISVKQMARPPFVVDDDVLGALRVRFPQIDLHTRHADGHLVVAATFSLSRGGYPVVEDAAFLATDPNWLPYDSVAGRELLAAAAAAGRRFTTPLRYAMATSQPLPAIVLTDTTEPVAAYIADRDDEAARALHAAEGAGVPAWVWRTEHAIPALPPLR